MPRAPGPLVPQEELGILVVFGHCCLHPAAAHVRSAVCIPMGPVGLCILSRVCVCFPHRGCFILQRMFVCIFIGGLYGGPTSLLQGAESSPFKIHIHSASQLSYSSRKTSRIAPTSSSTRGDATSTAYAFKPPASLPCTWPCKALASPGETLDSQFRTESPSA